METQERYRTECPVNGSTAASDGPLPVPDPEGGVRYRIDRVVAQIVVAKELSGMKIGEVAYNPATLFADPDTPDMVKREAQCKDLLLELAERLNVKVHEDRLLSRLWELSKVIPGWPMPWGASLEKLIEQAKTQAEQGG